MQRPRAESRLEPRYPVSIPAQLMNLVSTNRNCVITDFSTNGMRIELSRKSAQLDYLGARIRRGVPVSIGFTLPRLARRVRANADVMHSFTRANRLSFGIHFRVSNPAVLDAMRDSVEDARRYSWDQALPSAVVKDVDGGVTDATAVVAASAPRSSSDAGDLFSRYFSELRERLMKRYWHEASGSDAFRALVVVYHSEHQLRSMFVGDDAPAPEQLRGKVLEVVRGIDVGDEVRQLMIAAFDEASEAVAAASYATKAV